MKSMETFRFIGEGRRINYYVDTLCLMPDMLVKLPVSNLRSVDKAATTRKAFSQILC
ncbi:MAG: hypothetical protein ACOX2A_00805 [Tepidanaerobacteraceae bacterium]